MTNDRGIPGCSISTSTAAVASADRLICKTPVHSLKLSVKLCAHVTYSDIYEITKEMRKYRKTSSQKKVICGSSTDEKSDNTTVPKCPNPDFDGQQVFWTTSVVPGAQRAASASMATRRKGRMSLSDDRIGRPVSFNIETEHTVPIQSSMSREANARTPRRTRVQYEASQ